ncbi:sugar phosphate isomerase/epimerase family protein [Allokutzneria sp. NRRL B-24872]|uniref:sugar phosphate isomerase/epimerase family protein n=1 Tax=Allokutzneria sp. NRRL B-24872 TaxID=1137961 RepID=UPI000A3990B0|nr:sugar phosphate isomerase/epimerase family protein [Allokutzneria sp. NRRL B-24872]
MLLSCQEQMLPGATLLAKWDFARRAGFDAVELRGRGDLSFRDRLPELRQAKAAGVVMPTVCVEMSHFIGDFDAERRRDAIANMACQLSVMAELEGVGAMTPASWGMFSYRLPPFVPPRSAEEDRKVLLDALNELGEHAEREGVVLLLEPLNRYEDHMVNRLDHAIELIKATDSDGVRVGADTYHMNIEEAAPLDALREAAPWLGHVQISDSNRLEPGAGHLDWRSLTATLAEIDYSGSLAVECRLSGPPEEVLPTVPPLLR